MTFFSIYRLWVRRALKLQEGGSQIVVKLWNEHAQINVSEGQRAVMKNVRTSMFWGITTLNSTGEMTVELASDLTREKCSVCFFLNSQHRHILLYIYNCLCSCVAFLNSWQLLLMSLVFHAGRLGGYRSMCWILRHKHHMIVPHETVRTLLKQLDPASVSHRRQHRLHKTTDVV